MNCDDLRSLFAAHEYCQKTEYGLKLMTHCYYPSFDRVAVHISQYGEGFRVTDGGEAARCAFIHGRDAAVLNSSLKKAALRHSLATKDGMLIAEVDSKEWLFAAILAVANGAAMAATDALAHITEKMDEECERARAILAKIKGEA